VLLDFSLEKAMGTIVKFPKKRIVGSRLHPKARPRKKGQPWRFVDLQGERPRGHPKKIDHGPRGQVIAAVGQVWVMGHNQELWTIVEIKTCRYRGKLYPGRFLLQPYLSRRPFPPWDIGEQTFRGNLTIWDNFGAEMRALIEKLNRASQRDPQSLWRGNSAGGAGARAFFGLDADGSRID
jgi:hypothetical protein